MAAMDSKGAAMEAKGSAAAVARAKEPMPLVSSNPHDEVLPSFLRLRRNVTWWRQAGASQEVLDLILQGVQPHWKAPPLLSCRPQHKSPADIILAKGVLADYLKVGAVKLVSEADGPTQHLVPWFVISKQEGPKMKHRLISDCRAINQHIPTQTFKLETWREIFPWLRKGMWACKIDLRNAYFHLEVSAVLKPYLRLQVGDDLFQCEGAPFGLNLLPQKFMLLMKVLQRKWRSKGLLIFVYLDDLLLIGVSQSQVQALLQEVLRDLDHAGLEVNLDKSTLTPTQCVHHLGFDLDLLHGQLCVPQHKLKSLRKDLGKLLTKHSLTCRRMAAILGVARSFLFPMPFLRAFTDHLMGFVNQNQVWGWDSEIPIPPSSGKKSGN
jgi:hypothetical protein